jgi:hypothetical protein
MAPKNQSNHQMHKHQESEFQPWNGNLKASTRSDLAGTAPNGENENQSFGPLLDDIWKPYEMMGSGEIEVGFLLTICIMNDTKTIKTSEGSHNSPLS